MEKAIFDEARLRGSKFEKIFMKGSVFNSGEVLNCHFLECDMRSSSFLYTHFINSSFEKCNFKDSDISGAKWTNTSFPEKVSGRTCFYCNTPLKENFCEKCGKEIKIEGIEQRKFFIPHFFLFLSFLLGPMLLLAQAFLNIKFSFAIPIYSLSVCLAGGLICELLYIFNPLFRGKELSRSALIINFLYLFYYFLRWKIL
jgi:hypothetical protein